MSYISALYLLYMDDQVQTASCIYFKAVSVDVHTAFIYWMVCPAIQKIMKIEVLVRAERQSNSMYAKSLDLETDLH